MFGRVGKSGNVAEVLRNLRGLDQAQQDISLSSNHLDPQICQ